MKKSVIFASILLVVAGCVSVPKGWETASAMNVSDIATKAYDAFFAPDVDRTEQVKMFVDIAFAGKAEYKQALIDTGDKQEALRKAATAMMRCAKANYGMADYVVLCGNIRSTLSCNGSDADALFGLLLASMK